MADEDGAEGADDEAVYEGDVAVSLDWLSEEMEIADSLDLGLSSLAHAVGQAIGRAAVSRLSDRGAEADSDSTGLTMESYWQAPEVKVLQRNSLLETPEVPLGEDILSHGILLRNSHPSEAESTEFVDGQFPEVTAPSEPKTGGPVDCQSSLPKTGEMVNRDEAHQTVEALIPTEEHQAAINEYAAMLLDNHPMNGVLAEKSEVVPANTPPTTRNLIQHQAGEMKWCEWKTIGHRLEDRRNCREKALKHIADERTPLSSEWMYERWNQLRPNSRRARTPMVASSVGGLPSFEELTSPSAFRRKLVSTTPDSPQNDAVFVAELPIFPALLSSLPPAPDFAPPVHVGGVAEVCAAW